MTGRNAQWGEIPERTLNALRRSGLLDTPPDARFDRVTALVRDVLRVPVCLVSLVERDRQFFKSATGLPEPWGSSRETPLSYSFCQHIVRGERPLRVPDAREDARFCDNPAVEELKAVAYLGVPIHFAGVVIGALCAIDDRPRNWTGQDADRLGDFAAIVDSEIELLRLAAERDAEREKAEVLAREHAHRVKNSLSVAASLVTLSASEATSARDVARIARERILALASAQKLIWSRDGAGELRTLLDTILGPYMLTGDSMIRFDGQPVPLPEDKITPLSLIFHELATNASKYGALSTAGGRLELGWRTMGDRLAIRWTERLVEAGEPGDTPVQLREQNGDAAGEGFGTQLVNLCVRQLAANIEVGERPDGGREVQISLPWPGSAAAA